MPSCWRERHSSHQAIYVYTKNIFRQLSIETKGPLDSGGTVNRGPPTLFSTDMFLMMDVLFRPPQRFYLEMLSAYHR
jgi:hypothetical protein